MVVLVVQVLTDEVLHVEAAACENSLEVYRTEPHRNLPLIVGRVCRLLGWGVKSGHVLLGIHASGFDPFILGYLL